DRRRQAVRLADRAGGAHPHRRAWRGDCQARGARRLGVLVRMPRLRRLWRWIRWVATDTGEHARQVPIELERTRDGDYGFRLGVRAGFGGQDTARIPVARRTNPEPHPILKEIHYCEVAGQTLEAANVYALKAKVAALLE